MKIITGANKNYMSMDVYTKFGLYTSCVQYYQTFQSTIVLPAFETVM